MLKNSTYKDKFAMLNAWMPAILETIKKDVKNEHLKKDFLFVKKYFSGKNLNKVTSEELAEAYAKAIQEEEASEEIGEFLTNRWLLKHTEIYNFFETELTKINPNFNEIQELEKNQAEKLVKEASTQFGAANTYLFSILNSVVFPKAVFDQLGEEAKKEGDRASETAKFELEKGSIEKLQKSYDQQLARLQDKYEKKLTGLEKKYLQDVEGLKKQIANLQRKLNSK